MDYSEDLLYSFSTSGLAASGGALELYQKDELIDALCWGSATCENHHAKFSTKPEQNQSLVRCSAYAGIFKDCDASKLDFSFQTYHPDPKNTVITSSPSESTPRHPELDSGSQSSHPESASRHFESKPSHSELNSESTGSKSSSKTLKPCPAGKYRNPLTNRCKKLSSSSGSNAQDSITQKTCPAGQYRNPETGRCKKTITATATNTKTCKTGYERNPETNRCRKIKSDTTTLKPCKSGYERNPDTNRCRKKTTTNSGANYAVSGDTEADQEKPTNLVAFSSFGVAAVAATAYTGYQFRHKLKKLIFRKGD